MTTIGVHVCEGCGNVYDTIGPYLTCCESHEPTGKPSPIVCPMCQVTYEFELDSDGDWWPGHAEAWGTDQHPFLCSRTCYLRAKETT